MLPVSLLQILIEFGIVYLFFYLFVFVGSFFLKKVGSSFFSSSSNYGRLFYSFLSGLLIVISLYSLVVTKGFTVNILILPLLYFLLARKETSKQVSISKNEQSFTKQFHFLEVGMIALLSVIILHLFPESEYKQADSFFYLKIAESLNATGQENTSHYNNIYHSNFHGLEPYHYFEIWITAFIIRFTERFMPSINVERFITYGIILSGIIVELYCLVEEFVKQKINAVQKIFCWSLLFILPNLLNFFPSLYRIFISDFEGNLLERPNFRIIYLLLIPVLVEVQKSKRLTKRSIYLLLVLSVVSFKCTLVIVPSLILYGIFLVIRRDLNHRIIWAPLLIFCVAFASFYLLFPVDKLPSMYGSDHSSFLIKTLHGWKFILYSTVTSIIYIALLIILFILPLFVVYKRALIKELQVFLRTYFPFIVMAVTGLLMARMLYLKDNAYQFLFVSHILATIFIWLIYMKMLSRNDRTRSYLLSAAYLVCLWFIKPVMLNEKCVNVFVQNGKYVYEGKKYSDDYLKQVKDYFVKANPSVGGYAADTNFYKNTYYSRRNPNVYFLPTTYIIANNFNCNFEFCLSDTAAINYKIDNDLEKDYLDNAINRSSFFQYRLQYPTLTLEQQIAKFIADYHLSYLIVTRDYHIDDLKLVIKREIADPNTGERFLIIR